MLKKVIVFFYIILIFVSLLKLLKPINNIIIKPQRTQVIQYFEYYVNKPIMYLNKGFIEKQFFKLNKFYYDPQIVYENNNIIINFKYQKPVFVYKNSIITNHGKTFFHHKSFLLPTIDEKFHEIINISKNINEKFPIKLIANIKYENYQWVITTRNNQEWICGYSWNKCYKNLKNIKKKNIKNIITNNNHKIIFVLKNRLLMKKK